MGEARVGVEHEETLPVSCRASQRSDSQQQQQQQQHPQQQQVNSKRRGASGGGERITKFEAAAATRAETPYQVVILKRSCNHSPGLSDYITSGIHPLCHVYRRLLEHNQILAVARRSNLDEDNSPCQILHTHLLPHTNFIVASDSSNLLIK